MDNLYTIKRATPSIEVYSNPCASSGLSPKAHAALAIGLPNSLFAVQIIYHTPSDEQPQTTPEGDPIGMGRVIGDGGLFFQVVDIAVPAHQGKGLRKLIMRQIESWLMENVPKVGYVSLAADGKAKDLLTQFGFKETSLGDSTSVTVAWPVVRE
ncbi:hypothetical protein Hypma_004661 [Hypsizygus marmoreus]|uniref:Uncharacterized protein n=1 Tax=Hypsizygus marmoreus TaxID=39966 RepID=A0A369J3Z8_HYPMA|nr:hypothetical protein Hypma_004661 [Hypsizygus marmoreus]